MKTPRFLRRRRRRRMPPRNSWLTAGFVGGIVAGMVVWSVQMNRCRRDLFNASPIKRLAALGYLGGQDAASVEDVHVLTEYVGWEKHPILRRRGERLLKRMKQRLV